MVPSDNIFNIYYDIGRALPFEVQRFPKDATNWYKNQSVLVTEIHTRGKYGEALGFYLRKGEMADSRKNTSGTLPTLWPRKASRPIWTPCSGPIPAVLVLPCGRSAHTEAGWFAGRGLKTIVYMPGKQEPELMYKLFD